MSKGLKILVLFILVLALLTIAVINQYFSERISGNAVEANPEKCPPGAEQHQGCKWVQNQNTMHCQYIPENAVAWPWKEVKEGTCPQVTAGSPQTTPIVVVQPTPIPTPTLIIRPTPTTPGASKNQPNLPIPTLAKTPSPNGCDPCSLEKTKLYLEELEVTAESRKAGAMETQAAKP